MCEYAGTSGRGMGMSRKLYVGNLNYATTDEGLATLFGQYGEVISATVIKDRMTDRSKGFGFVEMAEDDAADAAMATLNGKEFEGRRIRVDVAGDRPPRREGFSNRGPRSYDRGDSYQY